MKTGTAKTYERIAGSPLMTWAAKTTRFPVMCAVNSPFRPRKPMVSVDPAIKLSTKGNDTTGRSTASDAIADTLSLNQRSDQSGYLFTTAGDHCLGFPA